MCLLVDAAAGLLPVLLLRDFGAYAVHMTQMIELYKCDITGTE